MRRIAVLAFLAAAGCSDGPSDKMFPAGAAAVVRSAKSVEAYRIDVPEHEQGKPYPYDWWQWPMKSGPVTVDAATATKLAQILLDDKSYYTGPPKACLPQPGVKVRFIDGTRSVTLLVCYECRQMFSRNSWTGAGGGGDFDPGAPALEEIAKQLFPKDGAIQSFTGLATPHRSAAWKDLAAGIETATSVDAWRIEGAMKGGETYFDYKELEGPVRLDRAAASALKETLSDPKLMKEGSQPCELRPGVKLRFNRPDPYPVWVFLCFECNELLVYEGKTPCDGRLFAEGRSKLLAVVKPLFPKDDAIQGLK